TTTATTESDTLSLHDALPILIEVPRNESLHLGRHFVLWIDRRHRAGIDAGATVDALVRIDVEHPVLSAAVDDAVHRADVDAGSVLEIDAGFGDDVGHIRVPNFTLAQGFRVARTRVKTRAQAGRHSATGPS